MRGVFGFGALTPGAEAGPLAALGILALRHRGRSRPGGAVLDAEALAAVDAAGATMLLAGVCHFPH